MCPLVDHTAPSVLVLECKGAAEGALSVVRTLGRRGIRVAVLSDDSQSLAGRSRFCEDFLCVPQFTQRTDEALRALIAHAGGHAERPVLFPTSDPDLLFVSRQRDALKPYFRLFLAHEQLIEDLSDKRRFLGLAARHGFPVPPTFAPANHRDAVHASRAVHYPAVLKPSHPAAWTSPALQEIAAYKKAIVVGSATELITTYERLAVHTTDVMVQEWIAGGDEAHFSLHAYIDLAGEPVGTFTGRKVRVHPAYAGSGCFVRSERVGALVESGLSLLREIAYTGIAVVNFKQDARSGKFLVHEINPRISQWNILATRCGVDVPFLAYAEACGMALEPAQVQREGVQYVHLVNDLKSFAEYRRRGDWTVSQYLRSLVCRDQVYQTFASDDLGPFLWTYARAAVRVAGRLRRPAPVPITLETSRAVAPRPKIERPTEPRIETTEPHDSEAVVVGSERWNH